GVLEQCTARADRDRKVLAAVPGERRRAELLQELSLPAVYVEMPGGKPRDEESVQHEVVCRQDLGGSYAPELVGERLRRDFADTPREVRAMSSRRDAFSASS